MSEENVEAVRAVYDGWREGDFLTSADVLDPLVLFVVPPEFLAAGTYLGLERLAEYTRGFLEPWTRVTIEAEEISDAGDSVVVAALQRGLLFRTSSTFSSRSPGCPPGGGRASGHSGTRRRPTPARPPGRTRR
jgi:ketosteroid isomerase-like protein